MTYSQFSMLLEVWYWGVTFRFPPGELAIFEWKMELLYHQFIHSKNISLSDIQLRIGMQFIYSEDNEVKYILKTTFEIFKKI